MLRVKDENGMVIDGIFKDQNGSIVVSNNKEYHKYIQEKNIKESVESLSNEVKDLKDMVTKLIEVMNNGTK